MNILGQFLDLNIYDFHKFLTVSSVIVCRRVKIVATSNFEGVNEEVCKIEREIRSDSKGLWLQNVRFY